MVSRFELYTTAAPMYLFPAVLFIASGGPENPLRFFLALSISVAMIGVSLMYTVMAMREKSRRQVNDAHDAEPSYGPSNLNKNNDSVPGID